MVAVAPRLRMSHPLDLCVTKDSQGDGMLSYIRLRQHPTGATACFP